MGSKKDGKSSKRKDKRQKQKRKVEKKVFRAPRGHKDKERYCVCQQTWDGNSLMVQCDVCQGWFHPKCVGVSSREARDNPFICPKCQRKPIWKLKDYKMNSYSGKIKLSHYETIDPKRLYQMYQIGKINQTNNNNNNVQLTSGLSNIKQDILNEINQNNNNNNNTLDNQAFYHQILNVVHEKKNKAVQKHSNLLNECFDYLLSCLLAKGCDLRENISKSKPFLLNKIISDSEAKQFVNKQIINRNINTNTNNSNSNHSDRMCDNLLSYCTLNIDTSMCLNCCGQIPSINYINHIRDCYKSNNSYYEHSNDNNNNKENIDISCINSHDLIYSTPYKCACNPPNPLEMLIDSQSESDIEYITDINDRERFLKNLIKKKNKYKYNNLNKNNLKMNHKLNKKIKSLKIWNKIYNKLMPKQEPEPADDIDLKQIDQRVSSDEDDDIPIAVRVKNQNNNNTNDNGYNLRIRSPKQVAIASGSVSVPASVSLSPINTQQQHINDIGTHQLELDNSSQKYAAEYGEMQYKFRKYYRDCRMKELKKKWKLKMKLRNNKKLMFSNNIFANKYNELIKKDKICINNLCNSIYNIHKDSEYIAIKLLSKYNSSNNYSKCVLKQLKKCNINTKYCGYLYKTPKIINNNNNNCDKDKGEDYEKKTMKMEIDVDGDIDLNDCEYSYYCRNKLNKNGLCSVHNNWRTETYFKLIASLSNEINEIFVLNCLISDTKNLLKKDLLNTQNIQNGLNKSFRDTVDQKIYNNNFFQNTEIIYKSNSSLLFNDPSVNDIDYLLNKMDDDNNNNNNNNDLQTVQQNIASNEYLFQPDV